MKSFFSVVGVLALAVSLSGCEKPPIETVQSGFRGTAMTQVYNPRTLDSQASLNAAPEISPPARVRTEGPTAGQAYQNVQILGDLSIGEFGRTMNAMTQWVSPEQGCGYCHVDGNFADDSKYTKIVARRMILMNRRINSEWKTHVANTGVTCYTCHRGQNLPTERWFLPEPDAKPGSMLQTASLGQNVPGTYVGGSSLPTQPLATFLLSEEASPNIRVNGETALPSGNRQSIKQAEYTFGLMIHMSTSLGVNCTYCHNTRAVASWAESTPQRTTAWYGIRMARDINDVYIKPLYKPFQDFPLYRLGPTGDAAKVSCGTCHLGAYKPLYGAAMAQHYPGLLGEAEFKAFNEKAIADLKAKEAAEAAAAAATTAAAAPAASGKATTAKN